MKITVHLPYVISMKTKKREIELSIPGKNKIYLDDLIQELADLFYTEIKEDLLDAVGGLHYHYFLNGHSCDPGKPIQNGDRVDFLDLISGG
jgi:molybdopterin converting factor small subunit